MKTISTEIIKQMVATGLKEDIAEGDITAALIGPTKKAQAQLICKEAAILCGTTWFSEVYEQLDAAIEVNWHFADGDHIEKDTVVCELQGHARQLLSGERTAINFLQTLSGVATKTYQYTKAIKHTNATILDTRKTIPGWRLAQKYAVRCGGGQNHRLGLYDAFLIKENHIKACGSITAAVELAKIHAPIKKITVEVENLAELEEALTTTADVIMLDNFSRENIKQAVNINQGCKKLEVSGNINFDGLVSLAELGIDYISIGALTKDIKSIDFSMLFLN